MKLSVTCLLLLVTVLVSNTDSARLRRQGASDDELRAQVQQQASDIQDLQAQVQALTNRLDKDETEVGFSVGFYHTDNNTAYEVPISKTEPVKFDNVLHNFGNGYDPSTGVFTVPHDGVYGFSLHFMATTGGVVHLSVKWVAGSRSGHGCFAFAEGDATDNYDQGSCTVLLQLQQGHQVYVADTHHDDNHPAIWSDFTTFTGVLIYPQ